MHFFRMQRRRRKTKRRAIHDTAVSDAPTSERVVVPSSENSYLKNFLKLKKTIGCWDSFFTVPEPDRVENWVRLEVLGNALCEKYSWAVPDSRALRILKNFSPLIEIGAGKGYISKLLQDEGVDIIPFDREIDEKTAWTKVKIGGPKKLLKQCAKGRNLFLCYPDEDSSMANPCLENFTGDYVIHIGELISTGGLSSPQAPWGRTSSADFQVSLMTDFHCVLVAEMPAFPFSRDCISVWKRTEFVRGKESISRELDGGSETNDDDSEEGSVDEDDGWASILQSERLPVTRAAPDFQYLL
jgi:hypothetical protein